jgi:hypothetical protein
MPTVYDFVNGCNHGYTFCVTLCSWVRLNTSNLHSWAHKNTNEVEEHQFQQQSSVNVWCGVLGDNLMGPHVTEGYLTAPYWNFLEDELPLHSEKVPLAKERQIRLEYDAAPVHLGRAVTEFLNKDYEGRWMGRGGPVALPTRSLDLNPLDLFLWGCMKSRVYHGGKPEARHQTVQAIDEAAVGVQNEMGCTQWQHPMAQ